MISCLIRSNGRPDDLAFTLAALVPAVAESLVADAIVLARANDEAAWLLAEEAGAHLAIGVSWNEGSQAARRNWLLCLHSGDAPGAGWMREAERFMRSAPQGAWGRFPTRYGGLKAFSKDGLAFLKRPRIGSGDLVHGTKLLALSGPPRMLRTLLERSV